MCSHRYTNVSIDIDNEKAFTAGVKASAFEPGLLVRHLDTDHRERMYLSVVTSNAADVEKALTERVNAFEPACCRDISMLPQLISQSAS